MFSESNGIDIHKVIEATNSQPFSHIHTPGIAVGGHCIPIYPRLYLWNDPLATVVRAAREANQEMPKNVVNTLAKLHGDLKGQRVVVLGASYRGGVKETAFSGVFPVVAELKKLGAEVYVHDPLYEDDELKTLGFAPYHYGEEVVAAIVQTAHQEYSQLKIDMLPGLISILDGRAITNSATWKDIQYHKLGTPL